MTTSHFPRLGRLAVATLVSTIAAVSGLAAIGAPVTAAADPATSPAAATTAAPKASTSAKATAPAPVNCRRAKCVALTFDDGPAGSTPQLLDTLKSKDAPATFFVLGQQAQKYPTVLKRISTEGHEIGNHTWGHAKLTSLSATAVRSEVQRTDDIVTRLTGSRPTFVRPPYGDHSASVDAAIARPIVTWSVDTRDWQTRNTSATIAAVKRDARRGSIVLMHDIHPTTVAAVPAIIDQLRRDGFTLVTVSQLLAAQKPAPGRTYASGFTG